MGVRQVWGNLMRSSGGGCALRLGAGILAGALAAAGDLGAAMQDAVAEDYPVPRHGELRLQVPAHWQVRYVYVEDGSRPPGFRVFPLEGSDFDMSMTVYWHDGMDQDITSAESLRARVEQAGAEAIKSSTDQRLAVVPLAGAGGPGFLYDLQDAAAAAGDYHYLTQGALAVGRLVLVFTILTDARPSPHREACLEFLRAIRHIHTPHGVGARGRPARHIAL
ncbi:MAG: hypothetical protein NFCOHLIN_02626 [Gammaproteobacteria bacterium]|nr:hypothetical protein [Gammaproteobacteria bacterium]